MFFMDHEIDESKLMTMAEVIAHLTEHGASYINLGTLRFRYEETFGADIVWNVQSCGDCYPGLFIMPVREGFLGLPYTSIDEGDFEIIDLASISLLDEDTLRHLLGEHATYSDALRKALREMILIAKEAS